MAAKQFGFYDNWKSAPLECPRCGWKGTFEQGAVEYYDDLMDCSCPECSHFDPPRLAIVFYPTIEESEQNWEKLTDEEKKQVQCRKAWLAKWDAASLKSIDQLPELTGPKVELIWDCVKDNTGQEFTVIRHGDTEIWREIACYESCERFREVVLVLKQKYGSRLADVVPTAASEFDLYGDKLSAPDEVEKIRKELKGSNG